MGAECSTRGCGRPCSECKQAEAKLQADYFSPRRDAFPDANKMFEPQEKVPACVEQLEKGGEERKGEKDLANCYSDYSKSIGGSTTTANANGAEMILTVHAMTEFCDLVKGVSQEFSTPSRSYFDREFHFLSQSDTSTNWPDGERPPYKFKSGSVYAGQWKGNRRHGYGVQRWSDGAFYQGQWIANNAEGNGRFQHANGDFYIGQWKNNVAHGMGTFYTQDKTRYEGEWQNDLQEGFAVETWPEGSHFLGTFEKGEKSGYGVYHWPDGSQYYGAWKSNSIHGYGAELGSDGRNCKGSWKGSLIDGCASYSWADGRRFRGQYVKDRKDGFGVYKWPDGSKYEGYFEQGKQHGRGKYTYAKGKHLEGFWSYGKREDLRVVKTTSSSTRASTSSELNLSSVNSQASEQNCKVERRLERVL